MLNLSSRYLRKPYILFASDFGWLLLSALGFSFALVAIRIFGEADSLRLALKLQSYVIIFSFIAQLGSRALVRRLIYSGLERLTTVLVSNTSLLLLFAAPIVFFTSILFEARFFGCLSILLALSTLYLTESVAKRNHVQVALYSLLNFFVASYGGLLYLYLGVGGEFDTYFIIETVACSLTAVLVLLRSPVSSISKVKKYVHLLKAAQSYQAGSINITLMMFFIMQGAINGLHKEQHIESYADLQVVAGAFSLVAGKVLLLLEKRIFRATASRFLYFSVLIVFTIFISLSGAITLSFLREVPFAIFFVISWVVFSRIAIGYVVQYISVFRGVLDLASVFSIFFFLISWFFVENEDWIFVAFLFSIFYLLFGMALFLKGRSHND